MDLLSLYRIMARIRAFELAAEEASIGGVAALGQQLDPRTKVRGRCTSQSGKKPSPPAYARISAPTTC